MSRYLSYNSRGSLLPNLETNLLVVKYTKYLTILPQHDFVCSGYLYLQSQQRCFTVPEKREAKLHLLEFIKLTKLHGEFQRPNP